MYYTLVIVAVTIRVALRTLSRDEKVLASLALVTLATLRSPFLPGYAVVPSLWLLTLVAAHVAPTLKTMGLVLLAWVALNLTLPQTTSIYSRLVSLLLLLPQATMVVLVVLALRTGRQRTTPSEA